MPREILLVYGDSGSTSNTTEVKIVREDVLDGPLDSKLAYLESVETIEKNRAILQEIRAEHATHRQAICDYLARIAQELSSANYENVKETLEEISRSGDYQELLSALSTASSRVGKRSIHCISNSAPLYSSQEYEENLEEAWQQGYRNGFKAARHRVRCIVPKIKVDDLLT
jgi:hypothetical protein